MKQSTVWSGVVFMSLVALTSLLLPDTCEAGQLQWVPQGRFGKRTDGLEDIKTALTGLQSSDGLRNVLLSNGRMRFAEDPYIQGDGVICLRTAHVGYYRCIRRILTEVSDVASVEET